VLEVVANEELKYSAVMKFILDLNGTKMKYYYENQFLL